MNFLDALFVDGRGEVTIDQAILADQYLAAFRAGHSLGNHTTNYASSEVLTGDVVAAPQHDTFLGAAVFGVDDHVLRHVHQPAGEIAGVGRAQRRIGQTLAGTVGRDEIFQRCQSVAEAGANWQRDNSPGRIRHQPTHACQLGNYLEAALGGT